MPSTVCPRLLLCLALAACASGGGSGHQRSDLITAAQLEQGQYVTLYDAVRTLRPAWLTARAPAGHDSPGEVQVYLDRVRLGGPGELHTVPVNGIEYLRYYTPVQATSRWGPGHGAGVIYVSSFAPEGNRTRADSRNDSRNPSPESSSR